MSLQRSLFLRSLAAMGWIFCLVACGNPSSNEPPQQDPSTGVEKPKEPTIDIEEPGKGNSAPDRGAGTPTQQIEFTLNGTTLKTNQGIASLRNDLGKLQITMTNAFACEPIESVRIKSKQAAMNLTLPISQYQTLLNSNGAQTILTGQLKNDNQGETLTFQPFGDVKTQMMCGDAAQFPSTTAQPLQGTYQLRVVDVSTQSFELTLTQVVFKDNQQQDITLQPVSVKVSLCNAISPLQQPVACAP